MGEIIELEVERDLYQSHRLKVILKEAALQEVMKQYPEGDTLAQERVLLPRWPSGLGPDFDTRFEGGFQGLVVLGGAPGVGKSTVSMACAMENMQGSTLVVYLDAENHGGEQRQRAVRCMGGEHAYAAVYKKLAMNFRWTGIDNRHSWETALLYAEKQITRRHKSVLFIIDSMQSLAAAFDPKRCMLQQTSELYESMNRISLASDGLISFLVLSELNKEAGMKGGVAQYRGTMILRISREESTALGQYDYHFELLKNRYGPFGGDLGLYMLDWKTCRFRRVDG